MVWKMPGPFSQAKGYGFGVSGMQISTRFIRWQYLFVVYFLCTGTTYLSVEFLGGLLRGCLQALIARQIRQIKDLDSPSEKGYPFFNSQTIQSSGQLSA